MSQTATHQVGHVIPHMPVRQRVQRVVTRHLLDGAELTAGEGHGGAVTLIQRFGSAANLMVQPQYPRCASD